MTAYNHMLSNIKLFTESFSTQLSCEDAISLYSMKIFFIKSLGTIKVNIKNSINKLKCSHLFCSLPAVAELAWLIKQGKNMKAAYKLTTRVQTLVQNADIRAECNF